MQSLAGCTCEYVTSIQLQNTQQVGNNTLGFLLLWRIDLSYAPCTVAPQSAPEQGSNRSPDLFARLYYMEKSNRPAPASVAIGAKSNEWNDSTKAGRDSMFRPWFDRKFVKTPDEVKAGARDLEHLASLGKSADEGWR